MDKRKKEQQGMDKRKKEQQGASSACLLYVHHARKHTINSIKQVLFNYKEFVSGEKEIIINTDLN